MATKEELFAAVRLVKSHCKMLSFNCRKCDLSNWCFENHYFERTNTPVLWPDPEEGGGGE